MKQSDVKPGDRYGKWTVLETGYHKDYDHVMFCLCQCDCGNTNLVSYRNLLSGISKSCGCGKATLLKGERGQNLSTTRLYKIWKGMLERCTKPTAPNYPGYGGRGITMCDEWQNSFLAFRDWSLSHGYREDLSIDRIDVNGNYYPDNCRWATIEQQNNNRRSNVLLTYDGKTMSIAQWAREMGVHYNTLRRRIKKWGVEKALSTPVYENLRRPHPTGKKKVPTCS